MAERDDHHDISYWFSGFMQGVSTLGAPQRDRIFRACARNCLAQGAMEKYGALFERAGGDLDAFFELLGEAPGVCATVVEPRREWELMFEECSCPLHVQGYVHDPGLCACARQSVTLVMHELWFDERFEVVTEKSILAGDPVCALRVRRVS